MSAPERAPKFRLTVKPELYAATVAECGEPFAESYLYGALQVGTGLTPRTLTGWNLMQENRDFMRLLGTLKINLIKPEPFHKSGNPHTAESPYGAAFQQRGEA